MNLKEMIDQSGMTRYKIAKESGLSTGSLDHLYYGRRDPLRMELGSAYKLAKVLGMSLDKFYKNITQKSDKES